jgi:hypothetical protein
MFWRYMLPPSLGTKCVGWGITLQERWSPRPTGWERGGMAPSQGQQKSWSLKRPFPGPQHCFSPKGGKGMREDKSPFKGPILALAIWEKQNYENSAPGDGDGKRRKQHDPQKRTYQPTRLRGATVHKTTIWTITDAETSTAVHYSSFFMFGLGA